MSASPPEGLAEILRQLVALSLDVPAGRDGGLEEEQEEQESGEGSKDPEKIESATPDYRISPMNRKMGGSSC
jgi:hypothetical protein